MAQTAKRALRLAGKALAWLGLAWALFLLAGWAGSAIPRNSGWTEPDDGPDNIIEIMVESNGVHTAIVMPATTSIKDWQADFPLADVVRPDRPYTHVSISWGEREVFLNTPTWWDLRPATVLRIVGFGGDGLLHVAHYVRPAAHENSRKIRLTDDQYRRLVAAIEAQWHSNRGTGFYPGYYDYDVFYDTGGRYTFTRTCNQWTSDMLAAAGVKTGWWTPFAGGVMKWLPDLDEQ